MKSRRCGNLLLSGFLGLCLLFLCTCALVTNANGDALLPCVNQETTETRVASLTADAYVKNGSGTNYGSDGNLIVGNYSDGVFYETFLMFSLPSSTSISWASLSFTYYASKLNSPLNISIYTTPTNWAQNTINWTNKPKPATKQGSVEATPLEIGLLFFKFKFTINDDLNTTMSLCLNASTPLEGGYIVGKSKEGANFEQEKPLLEYGVSVTHCVTVPGFDILPLLGFSAITIFILGKRLKKTPGARTNQKRLTGGNPE